MSLMPTGDRGQRYEVVAAGYPLADKECVIGWSESKEGADKIAGAIRQAPGCTRTTIRDRWGKEPDISRYCGILR